MTQSDIGATICVGGYSAAVRPAEAITEAIKRREMRAYGLSAPLHLVELDHLVPLSIGGSPGAIANLWPEDLLQSFLGAGEKDQLEDYLHRQVCLGKMALAAAQEAIATNWIAAYCAARLSECADGLHLIPAAARPGSTESD